MSVPQQQQQQHQAQPQQMAASVQAQPSTGAGAGAGAGAGIGDGGKDVKGAAAPQAEVVIDTDSARKVRASQPAGMGGGGGGPQLAMAGMHVMGGGGGPMARAMAAGDFAAVAAMRMGVFDGVDGGGAGGGGAGGEDDGGDDQGDGAEGEAAEDKIEWNPDTIEEPGLNFHRTGEQSARTQAYGSLREQSVIDQYHLYTMLHTARDLTDVHSPLLRSILLSNRKVKHSVEVYENVLHCLLSLIDTSEILHNARYLQKMHAAAHPSPFANAPNTAALGRAPPASGEHKTTPPAPVQHPSAPAPHSQHTQQQQQQQQQQYPLPVTTNAVNAAPVVGDPGRPGPIGVGGSAGPSVYMPEAYQSRQGQGQAPGATNMNAARPRMPPQQQQQQQQQQPYRPY
jgi:hypothetical protein